MKKKLVFVSLVLFCSLALLQYFALGDAFSENTVSQEPVPADTIETVQPVKSEIYSAGDYVVVKKDGKFFVFPKHKTSI